MSDITTLPVIPLREAVLFPGVTSPIAAGRPATLRAIEAALKTESKRIFVVAQRKNLEDVTPEILHTLGTVATIGPVQRGPSGMRLLLNGLHRGVAMRFDEIDDYLVAAVREAEEMAPLDPNAPAFTALYAEARERASELGRRAGMPKEAVQQFLAETNEPGRFADLVAGHLELKPGDAQRLLEALSVEERLRSVLLSIQRQIDVIDAQETIKSQVQEELGDRHREAFLRQQLKAIQKELGEDGGREDLEELRAKLEALSLPEAARKEVDREMARLERMGPEGMEAQVIRTYLETICELPWERRTEERLDIARASEILEEDHYGLPEVKDRILEFLAVRLLQQRQEQAASDDPGAESDPGAGEAETTPSPTLARDAKGRNPILLFAGPPGVGKTSVAQSIARAMGREYVRISLGGVRDEADIRGHRRTYVGAMPGRIIHGMKQAGSRNPVFLLDEVDKLGVSYQGDPGSALLEVLDPAQNDTFTDHYLGVPFDLSEVQFICTANFLQNIPGPLQDRMEVVEFAGYTEKEKLEIAKRYLVPRQVKQAGLDGAQISFADDAVQEVVSLYTRESGVRQLEREIGRLARKVARRIAAGEIGAAAIGPEQVAELLGRPKVHPEHAAIADQIGVATGMYYTPVGGDIMFVEASPMPGKGNLVLTGQLGEVMKESAQAAWTYAKAHAADLFIDPKGFEQDVHVHVPAGAIPKDGPSAGITMATALVSALSGRPARNDVAMTGEITLSGRVLPIGGVKEKVLGAVRAGISTIVLPKDNEADLDDLPEEIRRDLTIHLVGELGEALAHTLRGGEFREGKLQFSSPSSGTQGASQPLQH
ncbi:MAG: endopeptidase La [Thermoanaerobaculales bacterium]|jgi:ATP-dependent Lon protease|nr:endopeptidase La [Thermoanaerobaculales bacterium]